jgi:hypothetical protein
MSTCAQGFPSPGAYEVSCRVRVGKGHPAVRARYRGPVRLHPKGTVRSGAHKWVPRPCHAVDRWVPRPVTGLGVWSRRRRRHRVEWLDSKRPPKRCHVSVTGARRRVCAREIEPPMALSGAAPTAVTSAFAQSGGGRAPPTCSWSGKGSRRTRGDEGLMKTRWPGAQRGQRVLSKIEVPAGQRAQIRQKVARQAPAPAPFAGCLLEQLSAGRRPYACRGRIYPWLRSRPGCRCIWP